MKLTNTQIQDLASNYKTPMYIYDKAVIEQNINTMKTLCTMPNIKINYATKANSNLHILKLIREHNMKVDCTGYGEYFINKRAGFEQSQIYVVANNLTFEEMKQLTDQNLVISVDSIDQLKLLNEVAPGYQKLMIRVNPTFGAGDNESIVTGGANHKFGIDIEDFEFCLKYIKDNTLKLIGLNNHVGSLNLDYTVMIRAVEELLAIVTEYQLHDLQIINFGGGFGIDYNHETNNKLDLESLKHQLNTIFTNFVSIYPNKEVSLEFEPGRFIVANSAILVGTVTTVKRRGKDIYIGTDLGFSQLVRPVMYNSYHHVEFITNNTMTRNCHVVGNMCESGDYICKDRKLIVPDVGDLVIVYDTGAYGYSMSSNFNNRLRPIELLTADDDVTIIRNRQTLDDLLIGY
ncbi:diaminopimelate decarboxylase [Mollicutes bacterium LVI A0039]|nr:diaminopimelate decarboxylase [Mollicutes bacterium LVI A0039]